MIRVGAFWPGARATHALSLALLAFGSISCRSPAREGSAATPSLRKLSSKLVPIQVTCASSYPETCFNATDDNCNGLIDDGCGLPLGPLQVVAAWSDAVADVELQVVDPNLETAEVGRFLASGLTKDRDCPGERAECQGVNVETIFLPEGQPIPGKYSIRLSLERLGNAGDPVKVRLGVRVGPSVSAYEVSLERVGEAVVLQAAI